MKNFSYNILFDRTTVKNYIQNNINEHYDFKSNTEDGISYRMLKNQKFPQKLPKFVEKHFFDGIALKIPRMRVQPPSTYV